MCNTFKLLLDCMVVLNSVREKMSTASIIIHSLQCFHTSVAARGRVHVLLSEPVSRLVVAPGRAKFGGDSLNSETERLPSS
jgi:hypothetical protein